MDRRAKNVLWFLLSFASSFGAYLLIRTMGGGSSGLFENAVLEFTVAVYAIPLLMLAWVISRGKNRPLAQGFIWGLAAIFMFLFSYGGCGLLRLR